LNLLADLAALIATSGLTLFLLRYLHGAERDWMPWTAAIGGILVGIVARRAARAAWPDVPAVLARPVTAGVLAIGSVLIALASLAGAPASIWLLVGGRAATLAAAAAILALALAALAASHRRYATEVAAHRAREAALAEAALAAQLRALQAQMQPHFLFNTLNTLAELVHAEPARAEGLIGDLAHLLRHSLRSAAAARVPLREEWETVERALRIERARFGDRLAVELVLDPAAADVPIPGLVLQPLVENAVRHAIAPSPSGGRLRVLASLADGALALVVEDDGPGIPDEVRRSLEAGDGSPSGGCGGAGGALANVRRRLDRLGALRIGRSEWGGARVEVLLPQEGR
jgi:LytS/YehU family sensor histidine kinase